MNTKKNYEIGDPVWIYGVGRSNKLTKGTVVKQFFIDYENYDPTMSYFVIAIPTHIEPIFEVRSWETMSQDEHGPLGMFRHRKDNFEETNKLMSQAGYFTDSDYFDDEVQPDKINAVIDKIEKERSDTIFKPKTKKFRQRRSNNRSHHDHE